MNRKRIKSITSKILWVALFASVMTCEKDNMLETQVNVASETELQHIEPEITTQQLSFNDFPHKTQVKSYLHQINQNTPSTVLEHVSNSNTDDDFNPLTGLNIIQNQAEYTTYEGGHTYTFATNRNNDNGLIENIVLESQSDGSYNEYLMQYQLSDLEYQSLEEHHAIGFNLLDRTTLIPLVNGSFNALVTNSVNCEKEAYTYSSTMIIGFCTCPEHQASHQDGTCICEFAPRANVDYLGLKTKCSGGGGTTTVIGDNPGDDTDPGDFSSGGNGNIGDPNNSGNTGNPDDDDSDTDEAVDEIGGATKPFEILDVDTILADCLGYNTPSYYQAQSLSQDNKNAVANYINTNGCSDENLTFIEEVLDVLDDEGEVDFEENIIYDNSLNDYPCQKLIIQDAQGSCSPLTIVIMNLFESNDSINLIFKTSSTITDNGTTDVFSSYDQDTGTCNVTIKFRESYLETATDLAIARTSIHEMVHAIFVYMYEQGLLESEDGTPLEGYEDLLNAYINYQSGLPSNFGSAHHELMAEFVQDIATSLSFYAQSNNHTNSFSFYEKLSWGGLTGTDAYNILYPQSIDTNNDGILDSANFDRYDINRTILAEQNNETLTLNINGETYEYSPKGNTPNEDEPCN
ncbi:hypothetical protein [Winogradskyella sp. PC D3.3]